MNNLDPKKYGRNVLENVSFIVSSAFPDEKMHGWGLRPRLSGKPSIQKFLPGEDSNLQRPDSESGVLPIERPGNG